MKKFFVIIAVLVLSACMFSACGTMEVEGKTFIVTGVEFDFGDAELDTIQKYQNKLKNGSYATIQMSFYADGIVAVIGMQGTGGVGKYIQDDNLIYILNGQEGNEGRYTVLTIEGDSIVSYSYSEFDGVTTKMILTEK